MAIVCGRAALQPDVHRCAASLITFSQRVCEWGGTRVLTLRELSAVGHGDHCHDDPQRDDQYEVIDHVGHPCRLRHEDEEHAGCETRVHERHHEQALGTVVDPHHEHPVDRQDRDIEEERGQQEVQGELPGGLAGYPDHHTEVVRSPQEAHDEPGRKNTITLS